MDDKVIIISENKDMNILKTGTTTVGILYKDGVVLAADKKATMGHLVASKEANKIHHIIDSICMTIAGSVGDAQAMIRLLRAELELYKYEHGYVPVKAAVVLLANILRASYKSFHPELVQLIVGGYDSKPHLYSIDAAGGIDEASEYTFSGSGSVIAVGVLENGYRKDLKESEAIELAIRSIKAAAERDTASGGKGIDVVVMNKDGYRRLTDKEVDEILRNILM